MEIDILTPALSSDEIAEKQCALNTSLKLLENKKRIFLLITSITIALILLATVASNAAFSFLPWNKVVAIAVPFAFVFCFSILPRLVENSPSAQNNALAVIFCFVVGFAICIGVALSNSTRLEISTNLSIGEIGISLVFGAYAVVLSRFVHVYYDKVEDIEKSLTKLELVDNQTCIEISELLSCKQIKEFRDSVLAQRRTFIKAELYAMRKYFCDQDARAKIEAAYLDVYATDLNIQGISQSHAINR